MATWLNCSYQRSWEYNSPFANCLYEPTRYVAKKATIVAKIATVSAIAEKST